MYLTYGVLIPAIASAQPCLMKVMVINNYINVRNITHAYLSSMYLLPCISQAMEENYLEMQGNIYVTANYCKAHL